MTPLEIADQIEAAAVTMSRMPKVQLKQCFCAWPEYIHTFGDWVGRPDIAVTKTPRIKPTSRQLQELDQVIGWMAWLGKNDKLLAQMVQAWAEGAGYRKIAAFAGCCDKTAKRRIMAAMVDIAAYVNYGRERKRRFRRVG